MESVPQPAGANLSDLLYLWRMSCSVANLIDNGGIDAVEHSRENLFCVLNDDTENRDRNHQTDERIGQRITDPDAKRADKYGKARPTVDTCVMAVRDQSGTIDVATDPDAEHRHAFVADKADDRSERDGPQICDVLWVEEAIDTFITGHDRAGQDDQQHRQAGQIFDAAVTEGEASARALARQQESNPERNGSGGIGEIVNGVGKQRDAAGERDDENLEHGCRHQADERPLYGP